MTHNGLTTVSNSIPGTLMSSNNQHVLTPVPGDPSGRLVMTLLPQGHDHIPTGHGTNSSHSARYGHAGQIRSSSLIYFDSVMNEAANYRFDR